MSVAMPSSLASPHIAALLILLAGALEASAQAPSPSLPLKVSADHRSLVDQKGTPFLVVGDSPWSLIVQADAAMADLYLADRRKRGFNAIIVNLIEHKFASHPPQTRAGLAPFLKPGDFTTPNPAYFDYAHHLVKKANEHGIVVWLAPAYLGSGGGDEGWFQEMKASGRAALRHYGRFVGARFKDLPNIVWLMGGDYTPQEADRWTVSEVAEGIREQDTIHLMTGHSGPGQSAARAFGNPQWLDVNTTYSYEPNLFRALREDYAQQPIRPLALIESAYENEHNTPPERIRCQAYWALLCGACGQFFGNNPLWHFDGPGLYPSPTTWRQALDSVGARDISRLRAAFVGRAWSRLVPDPDNPVVVEGAGHEKEKATSARTPDGGLALTYLPSTGVSPRRLTVDLSRFAGPVTARWFNPTNGKVTPVADAPFPNHGSRIFETPGDNGAHTNDWLLILEARRAASPR